MSTPTRSLKPGRAHDQRGVQAQPAASSYAPEPSAATRTPRYVGDGRGPALTLLPPGGGDAKTRKASEPDAAGQPLPATTRETMESRFAGADFGDVRVHTEPRAADAATAFGASAYTLGRDIVFAEGEYEPGTEAGDRLIAHELTHVLQQTSGEDATRPQAAPSSGEVEESESEPEAEAESNAEAVARGERVRVRPVPGGVRGPQLYPARVSVRALEAHQAPDVNSPVVFTLRRGQEFDAGELLGDWQQVTVTREGGAQQGYVPTTEGIPYLLGPIQQPPNPYTPTLLGGAPSLSALAARPTPYLARIVRNYAAIYHAPPTPTQPGQTATTSPAPMTDFGDQTNIFITVTWDRGGEWVGVRHAEHEGWMRRSNIVPVTGDTQRDVQQAVSRHVTGSESHDRPGHYSRDDRDNVGIGSWTCGRIAGLMRRYRAVFRRHNQESRLYGYFGNEAHFNEIQRRFIQHRECSEEGGFFITPEEGRMFENAGNDRLIREAEEEQMDIDFASYMPDPATIRPIYPWIDADDTISEIALAMLVSIRHRGEPTAVWQGAFRTVRAEYEAHPERFPNGEADFLRAVGLRLAGRHQGIRNRYLNVVTAFRESRRRFSLRRATDAGQDADEAPAQAPTPTSPTPAAAPRAADAGRD